MIAIAFIANEKQESYHFVIKSFVKNLFHVPLTVLID